MQDMQASGAEKCPFGFNFDPVSFKVGDTVSYRVESMDGFPFVGTLIDVQDDHVVISSNDATDPGRRMRGTRESRPLVPREQALG